jgi:hypothetical protein
MDFNKDDVESLCRAYPGVSYYEAIMILLKDEQNIILRKAFCVSDQHKPYLEDLVKQLKENGEDVASAIQNVADK